MFSDNSFAIILTPALNENNQWTGEVTVAISHSRDNDMSKRDKGELELLCEYMAASLAAMEENSSIRELLESYIGDSIVRTEDSNVDAAQLMLNLMTKTEGSA
jgi:hypothetical protein